MEVLCPWCGFKADGEYAMHLHIEEHHTDDSPFAVREPVPDLPPRGGRVAPTFAPQEVRPPSEPWTRCTRRGCGDYVQYADIDEHLEMHEAVTAVEEDERQWSNDHGSDRRARLKKPRGKGQRSEKREGHSQKGSSSNSSSLLQYFSGSSSRGPSIPINFRNPLKARQQNGRLGTAELGPHAFENSMPSDVRRVLEQGGRPVYENKIGPKGKLVKDSSIPNETTRLVPIMADLSSLDRTTTTAYYCDRHVRHVHKLRCDGNFCGYWNIQMLLSHLYSVHPDPTYQDRQLPTVLQLQNAIEDAWDAGTCTYGRTETGGIRNTRKWIGTHEAAAYFLHTGVPVTAMSFKSSPGELPAHMQLLDYIEAYFMSALECAKKIEDRVYITQLPPVYFQRAGHSLTIIGLERTDEGDRELIMLDSTFATTEPMKKLVSGRNAHARVSTLMKPYRKDEEWLERWKEFEILIPMAQDAKQT